MGERLWRVGPQGQAGVQALGQWGWGQVGSGGRAGNHRGDRVLRPRSCRGRAGLSVRPRGRNPGPWGGLRFESLPCRVGAAEGKAGSESFWGSRPPALAWLRVDVRAAARSLSVKVSVDRDEDRRPAAVGPAQGPLRPVLPLRTALTLPAPEAAQEVGAGATGPLPAPVGTQVSAPPSLCPQQLLTLRAAWRVVSPAPHPLRGGDSSGPHSGLGTAWILASSSYSPFPGRRGHTWVPLWSGPWPRVAPLHQPHLPLSPQDGGVLAGPSEHQPVGHPHRACPEAPQSHQPCAQ